VAAGTSVAVGVVVLIVALLAIFTVRARAAGYGFGGRTYARCRRGHLFTTIWVPGASIKAIRLGWKRAQFCPVGHHFTIVEPLKASDLTDAQRAEAESHRDASIP
jgi:hypothetical protein